MKTEPKLRKPTPFPFTHTSLWVHAIFPTLDFQPLLPASIRSSVFQIVHRQLESIECQALAMQGTEDHIHILFRQNPNVAVSYVMKQIKGASSHEINARRLTPERFAWQPKFQAYSIEQPRLHLLRVFINKQDLIHQTISSMDEMKALIQRNGSVPQEWLEAKMRTEDPPS